MALKAWHAPTPGASVSKQVMHRALHASEQEFGSCCHAQPAARIVRALDDAKAANVLVQAYAQLAR
jgi:hypothetical protein